MSKVYCEECKHLVFDGALGYGPEASYYYCKKREPKEFAIDGSWRQRPAQKEFQERIKPHIRNKSNDCDLWEKR